MTRKIGATGLEPAAQKSQADINKELTEKVKRSSAQKLPKSCNSCPFNIAQNDTELQEIITAWPELPEHIKAAIKTLVQSHKAEKKE